MTEPTDPNTATQLQPNQSNPTTKAKVAFWLGIASLPLFFFWIIAIPMGITAVVLGMSTKKEPCNKSLASKAIVLGGIGTLVSFLALVASAIYFYSAEQGDKREILESRQSYAYDGSCYECGGSVHFHFEGDLENGFMVTDSSHRILSTCWVFIIPVDPESFPALKTEPGAYQCQKCNSAINVIKDGEFYKFTCKHKYGCSLSDYHFDQEDLE